MGLPTSFCALEIWLWYHTLDHVYPSSLRGCAHPSIIWTLLCEVDTVSNHQFLTAFIAARLFIILSISDLSVIPLTGHAQNLTNEYFDLVLCHRARWFYLPPGIPHKVKFGDKL